MTAAGERLQREQEFHDQRFSDDSARADVGRFYRVAGPPIQRYQERVEAAAPGARLLEFGCGVGSRAHAIAPIASSVTGIDISSVAIDWSQNEAAERRLTNTTFVVADAESTDLEAGGFDLVFGSGILHHLDLEAAIRELDRLLSDDGCAVFLEPLGHNPAINWYRGRTPEMRSVDEHPLLIRDLDWMAERFAASSFEYHALVALAGAFLGESAVARAATAMLELVDGVLLSKSSALQRHAWMVLIHLQR